MSPRTGRPTTNPRRTKLGIRINDESKRILETYTNQEKITTTEAVERGIKKLEAEIKK